MIYTKEQQESVDRIKVAAAEIEAIEQEIGDCVEKATQEIKERFASRMDVALDHYGAVWKEQREDFWLAMQDRS